MVSTIDWQRVVPCQARMRRVEQSDFPRAELWLQEGISEASFYIRRRTSASRPVRGKQLNHR